MDMMNFMKILCVYELILHLYFFSDRFAFVSKMMFLIINYQDTITGFLLAGVGNVDIRRKTNYLIVDSSMLFLIIFNCSAFFSRLFARDDFLRSYMKPLYNSNK